MVIAGSATLLPGVGVGSGAVDVGGGVEVGRGGVEVGVGVMPAKGRDGGAANTSRDAAQHVRTSTTRVKPIHRVCGFLIGYLQYSYASQGED